MQLAVCQRLPPALRLQHSLVRVASLRRCLQPLVVLLDYFHLRLQLLAAAARLAEGIQQLRALLLMDGGAAAKAPKHHRPWNCLWADGRRGVRSWLANEISAKIKVILRRGRAICGAEGHGVVACARAVAVVVKMVVKKGNGPKTAAAQVDV